MLPAAEELRSRYRVISPRALVQERLGPFRVERLLGEGAMSEVYAAVDERLDRRVALKVLRPHLARSGDVRRRFASESRLASQLDHPNIITIYDADEIDRLLYISMRLVEGPDLGALIEFNGPLSPSRSARIIRQAAAALDAAHASGLIHRDVKPANILVARTERGSDHVFLGDFGLTRSVTAASRHTQTGEIVGSVHYMSPEQIEGRHVTSLSDVYSLGCVLYECLTGKVPFERDSDLAVLWAHVNAKAPAVSDVTALPRTIDSVIQRALAKDPEARYQTCGELATALRGALRRRHLPPPRAAIAPTSPPHRELTAETLPPSRRLLPSLARGARSVLTTAVLLSLVGSVVVGAFRLSDRSSSDVPSATPNRRGVGQAADAGDQNKNRMDARSGGPARNEHPQRSDRRGSRASAGDRGAEGGAMASLDGDVGDASSSSPAGAPEVLALAEREVSRHYDAPTFDGYGPDCVTDNVGCVEFRAQAEERFVSISISDNSGQPVFAWIKRDVDADGDADGEWVDICGDTDEPIAVSPGTIVKVLIQTGDCGGAGSTPTSGTVTAVFSHRRARS